MRELKLPERPETADTPPGNLWVPLTRLLGREDALAELVSLLWGSRLLVLRGPGGVGKSRLALALAESVRGDLIGGAWWVDLSATVDPDLVNWAAAAAVLPGAATSDPVAAIGRELAQPALLVLDNAEQVSDACAALTVELLERTPQLRILVTSRQSLGVPGERVWRVPGLAIDGARHPRHEGDADADAVALFVQRAREASDRFDPKTPENHAAVQEICRWLDGNPLAIELAAARVGMLSVPEIAARLRGDVGLLSHSRRVAPDRQRALINTLEWSHRLLDDEERRVFGRLGIFRGGFSLSAAEAVCSDERLPAAAVLDLIGQLVDRSLVDVVEAPGDPRFRLAATVRQFALRKLADVGETDTIRDRHADFFAGFTERNGPRPGRGPEHAWVESLELELDNLREAMARLADTAPARVAGLACALWPFCRRRGHYAEARGWLEAALVREADLPDDLAVEVLIGAGEACFLQCDYSMASAHLQRAAQRLGSGGDPRQDARIRQRLGAIAREQGDYGQARRLHAESAARWSELDDAQGVAASESDLSFAAWLAGDFASAEELGARALARFRAAGNLADTALTLINLGATAGYRDEFAAAVAWLDEALTISRRLGFQEGIAWSLHELAIVGRRRRGAVSEPEIMLRDALLIHHQLGDRWRTASVLEEIAGSALARSDNEVAARLLGAAAHLREQIAAPIPPAEADDHERVARRLRRRLGEGAFRAAFDAGRDAPLDGVVATAADAMERHGRPSASLGSPRVAPVLTAREMGVLELLGAGATNREIAEALYISASTAGVHVSNILRKLGAKRRVDAAARAQALGLLSGVSVGG